MKKFTADFETATWLEDETYVWAWATCEIGNEENLSIGTSIDEFINFCYEEKNCTCYFHNLKFDRRIYNILGFKKWVYSRREKRRYKGKNIYNTNFRYGTILSNYSIF